MAVVQTLLHLVLAVALVTPGPLVGQGTRGAAAPGTAVPVVQPVPFRDPASGRWGYRQADGRVVIPARFVGAGLFVDGRAPIQDGDGFGVIDRDGRILERIETDAVSGSPAAQEPAATCAWQASMPFPAPTLECYARQLRGTAPAVGGEITIRPRGGEGYRAAVIWRFAAGAVLVEDVRYEGFRRRLLLPGVTVEQAAAWRRLLFPDRPQAIGCGESWQSGAVTGGAFIEQHAGC